MEKKEFNKAVHDFLTSHGFQKKGNHYNKHSEDIIVTIGTQKSSYSNSYYVNVGYIITELNKSLTSYRYVDGDIRARFDYATPERQSDLFELDKIEDESQLKSRFSENNELVEVKLTVEGLKEMIAKRPNLLYQTKIKAKEYLGFE